MTDNKKTGAGRPAFSEHGSIPTFVRLPVDVRDIAQREADKEGISLSSFIRAAVARAVRSDYADPVKGGKK